MRPQTSILLLAVGTLASPALGAGDEPLSFRGGLSWINAYVRNEATENPRNPGNALAVPEDSFVSELRPNIKIVSPQAISVIARPRVTWTVSRARPTTTDPVTGDTEDGKLAPARPKTSSTWSEGYVQWTLSDAVTFAYGQQNYQWGAAESLSPSNRLVHENVNSRNALYDVRGKHLARMNLSAGKVLSLVIMHEFQEDEDASVFRFAEEFESASQAKLEVNWSEGASYLGLVGGSRESGSPWFGQYVNFSLPFFDAISLYADASQQRGSDAWYPVATEELTLQGPQEVVALRQDLSGKKKVYGLTVAGIRYDFENGNHLRLEYINNEAGYDEDEVDLLKRAMTEKTPWQLGIFQQNLERSLAPGLELLGRKYGFASASLPDVFKVQDLMIYVRTMHSLTDKSSASYLSVDYGIGDAGTILVAGSYSNGHEGSELQGFASPSYLAGYKHQW